MNVSVELSNALIPREEGGGGGGGYSGIIVTGMSEDLFRFEICDLRTFFGVRTEFCGDFFG